MPELRSGVRRGCAPVVDNNNKTENLVATNKYIKTRAAVAREAAQKRDRKPVVEKPKAQRRRKKEEVVKKDDIPEKKGKEVVGKMADGSGGLSANKGTEEEEGNTAPFPERVLFFSLSFRD